MVVDVRDLATHWRGILFVNADGASRRPINVLLEAQALIPTNGSMLDGEEEDLDQDSEKNGRRQRKKSSSGKNKREDLKGSEEMRRKY